MPQRTGDGARRGSRPRRPIAGALGGALLATLVGCLTPPVMIEAPFVDLETALPRFPEGTETVAVTTYDGAELRGLFVPAGEGAPVVLHLLESAGSVGSLMPSKSEIAHDYANLGFASLLIDYRGVGISPGERSPGHLEADVHAMFGEAVRRAGASERVVVRAHSIGTIALALLLEHGVRPAGIIALSPVDARTVARRFAREHLGWWASLYASIAYRPAAKVDVYGALAAFEGPILVAVAERDELIRDEDVERLRATSSLHLVCLEGDHLGIGGFFQATFREEIVFVAGELGLPPLSEGAVIAARGELSPGLRARLEARPRLRSRFEAALPYARGLDRTSIAAVAEECDDPVTSFRWLRILRRGGEAPPFDACRAMLHYEPAIEAKDLDGIDAFSLMFSGMNGVPGTMEWGSVPTWLQYHLAGLGLDDPLPPLNWNVTWEEREGQTHITPHATLAEFTGISDDLMGARRRMASIFLRASGIPCRSSFEDPDEVIVEYWRRGEWHPLRAGFTIQMKE